MKQPQKVSIFFTFWLCLFTLQFLNGTSGICQEWSVARISLLPDSSLALVKMEKDKKVRHCPHHDANGNLDEEQLINVLGNFDSEVWVDQTNREVAEKHLTKHYDNFMTQVMKQELRRPININLSKPHQLHIGLRAGRRLRA